MSQGDRLTRQELTWLLTQEARTAAQALRKGVSALSQPPPAQPSSGQEVITINVESSLDTLDDAMRTLASLHSGTTQRGRRGRFDLAAVVCEVAPNARVHIAPGSGTELFGDESVIRRMIQVFITQTTGAQSGREAETPEVRIERSGNEVRVSVALGPDSVIAAPTEQAWLNRMAMRFGGRLELEGRQQSLVFPAEGAAEQSEVEALRKELHEAQQQGEAYARELAAMLMGGESTDLTPAAPSTVPPASGTLEPLTAFASSIASNVRAAIATLTKITESLGQRSVDVAAAQEAMQPALGALNETLSELGRFSKVAVDELPSSIDLAKVAHEVASEADGRASRHGISISVATPERVSVVMGPSATRAIVRTMIDHAIAATPRGESITLTVEQLSHGVVISVDDCGVSVPMGARQALIRRRIDPASIGRPSGMHLVVLSALVEHLNGTLEVGDTPKRGNRTSVTLPVL